ncbi:N-acetyltransferase [Bacillus clarus]|uniref:N-acetyltransferase n=1 Tax=Bacillus clarus TaxID=2338372 RepID=A0ABX9KN55_9BACI|nr:GNAT family N-acetyltransferase [Bacillus clarus]RFT62672.1 N-acetyltransferase [Bacillus clarus]
MEIFIEKLRKQDAKELFTFECTNKEFFEKTVPSRGSNYYVYAFFQEQLEELLKEQEAGISYFYLIRNSEKQIVGRVNVVDINKEKQIGYLGYRVGEKFIKRGVARAAVKLLLNQIVNYKINEIHAKTTTKNIASQIVLEKNGFTCNPIDTSTIDLNGEKMNFVHYIWKNTNIVL